MEYDGKREAGVHHEEKQVGVRSEVPEVELDGAERLEATRLALAPLQPLAPGAPQPARPLAPPRQQVTACHFRGGESGRLSG